MMPNEQYATLGIHVDRGVGTVDSAAFLPFPRVRHSESPERRVRRPDEYQNTDTDVGYLTIADYTPSPLDWQRALQDQLVLLGQLDADWDPEGAAPPTPTTLVAARNFARLLVSGNLACRSVTPSVEEGLAFNFHQGSRYGAIEFLNDGSVGLFLFAPALNPIAEALETQDDLAAAIDRLRDFVS